MTAQFGSLRSLDDWLLKQAIEQAERGISVEKQLIPTAVEELGGPSTDLYSTRIFELEVANGGLPQFFENSSGALAPVVRDALERMSLPDYAAIIAQLIDALGSEYPVDYLLRAERMEATPAFQEQLERGYRAVDVWTEEFMMARENHARRHGLIK